MFIFSDLCKWVYIQRLRLIALILFLVLED